VSSNAFAAGLPCMALGLALGSAQADSVIPALVTLLVTVAPLAVLRVPTLYDDPVRLGCWASVVINAACVHRARGLGAGLALALSVNAGLWVGALIAVSPSKGALLATLPCALVGLPSAWARGRGGVLALKVVSSWLMAVAILAATLQFLPETPGYLPDHLE
jgi:hypothetical protein